VEDEISLEEFVFGYSIRFAMVKTNENTCIRKVNVLPQDSGRPEEDVGVIIGSGKQEINIGGFVRHEEWEQSFDELKHSRQWQVLDACWTRGLI
jgi:hypothetical protein